MRKVESYTLKSSYQIKLDAFEGPMDVLMHLIESQKVEIYDIPIVKITEQYLKYLSQMKKCDLEITGEFLVMAATLIDIKSKMLLPVTQTAEDEEDDPRIDLVERLIEYKKFKGVAKTLKDRENTLETRFFKTRDDLGFLEEPIEEDEHFSRISVTDLMNAWEGLVVKSNAKNNEVDLFNSIQKDPVTVEEKVQELKSRLEKESHLLFEKIFETSVDKIHLITTFLAILELAKNRIIVINQNKKTCSIVLRLREKIVSV